MTVDGPKSVCIKSEFYDLLQSIGYPSLVNTRVGHIHATRRREWRAGFSKEAISQYEERVAPHIDQLLKIMEDDVAAGCPSNIRDYMYWFGFDAMGEFVLSKSFDMLENRQPAVVIERLQRALSLLGPLTPTPWLLHLGLKVAPRVGVIRDWFDTLAWCRTQMWNRLNAAKSTEKLTASVGDLAYHLMEDSRHRATVGENSRNWNMSWLTGDSLLAIVAGRWAKLFATRSTGLHTYLW